MKVAVLGANGFIGHETVLKYREFGHSVCCISKENYDQNKGQEFDLFINAAGNKRAFWANQYPNEDFKIATSVVYQSLFDFPSNKYVFISSIAVYDEPSHYGFNKKLSEQIVQRYASVPIIMRPCNIVDSTINIGLLADIKNNTPLFVTLNSKMQFITRKDFVRVMMCLVDMNVECCINVGGIGSVTIEELQDLVGKKAIIKDTAKYRNYEMDVSELSQITKIKSSRNYVLDTLEV